MAQANDERNLSELQQVLQRLDALLARASAATEAALGPDAARDPFRGLHIGDQDVARLLARSPGDPLFNALAAESAGTATNGASPPPRSNGRPALFGAAALPAMGAAPLGATTTAPPDRLLPEDVALPDLAADHPSLKWLARLFGLTRFDLDVLVIALAGELDTRYERLYAYLQDDVTRRRPTVALALSLLCPSAAESWQRRAHFAADAPLVRHGLLGLVPDPQQTQPPLLAQYLKIDERIIDVVLGHDVLDRRLNHVISWAAPDAPELSAMLPTETVAHMEALLAWYRGRLEQGIATGLLLYLQGPANAGKRATAAALAAVLDTGLLVVDCAALLRADDDPEQLVTVASRESLLHQVPLYWDGFQHLAGDEPRAIALRAALQSQLQAVNGLTVLGGTTPWEPTAALQEKVFIRLEVPLPPFTRRRALWEQALTSQATDAVDIPALANSFRLGPPQIDDAVATARSRALWRDPADGRLTMADLVTACRAQSHHKMGSLARQILPIYGWEDIVLPADQLSQLHELSDSVRFQPTVYVDWGFERKMARGKGTSALFTGPSGTGKTMSAEIVANALGLDLYKIELSGVVSKYIGETEKNLERIFEEAQRSNAILFFDEADALFGKRSETNDAHDRYANIEVSYLLQRMEEYEGITVLATNFRSNLDEAFVRRLRFQVDFPFPEEGDRLRIWQKVWPLEMPRDADLDLPFIARQFPLAGGNIKNIALAAAFRAAADGQSVGMAQVIRAIRREYQKMGKPCSEAEFGPYFEWVRP
ncbi:MAG: ATP-binding protein [Anaerolineae bacterium]